MKLLSVWVAPALLLTGCDRGVDFSKSGTMEEVASQGSDIAQLQAEVRRLRQDLEIHEKMDMGWRDAAVSDFERLQRQVAHNAEVNNKNEKIDDERWNAVRQRLGF